MNALQDYIRYMVSIYKHNVIGVNHIFIAVLLRIEVPFCIDYYNGSGVLVRFRYEAQ